MKEKASNLKMKSVEAGSNYEMNSQFNDWKASNPEFEIVHVNQGIDPDLSSVTRFYMWIFYVE